MRSLVAIKALTTLVGVSLVGVAGYLVYLLIQDDDDDYDYDNRDDDYLNTPQKIETREYIIPKRTVCLVIGHNGDNIKKIEHCSNTKISFKNSKTNITDAVCMIRGSLEAFYMAATSISCYVDEIRYIETSDMWVPQHCVGRIIGTYGQQILDISDLYHVSLHFADDNREVSIRRLIIKGRQSNILRAKSYIEGIIKECEIRQQQMEEHLAKREPRMAPKALESPKGSKESPKVERISPIPGQPDSQFDVYVSAMIDPSHFWLQIVGPKATELDQLVEDMTEYYSRPENQEFHILDKVNVGDLVAALFKYDNKWYRAEVLRIIESSTAEPEAEVYYVDYGDTDIIPCKATYEVRTDFLQLHFQAIECYLNRVEPIGESWSSEAVDKFEEWTYVAQWKKLSAKINGYTNKEKTRAKREGSPIPGVDLFDVINNKNVNIAKQLVKYGYAVFKTERDLSSSRTTSTSSVSTESVS